jgi:hypothetical protein
VPAAFLTISLNLFVTLVSVNRTTRITTIAAGGLGIAFVPLSWAIHPTMHKLKALGREGILHGKADGSDDAVLAVKLMGSRRTFQGLRTALFGCIWALCVMGLVVNRG